MTNSTRVRFRRYLALCPCETADQEHLFQSIRARIAMLHTHAQSEYELRQAHDLFYSLRRLLAASKGE